MQPEGKNRRASRLLRLVTAACLILAALSTSCGSGSGGERLVNEEYGFSFIPPKGWEVHSGANSECTFFTGTYKDADRYIYACVDANGARTLASSSDQENCAELTKYVQNRMNGRKVDCRTSHIQRAKAYTAMFIRDAYSGGRPVVQFVNLTAIAHKGALVMMAATSMGATVEEAKNVFQKNLTELTTSAGSFWVH